MKKLQPFIAVFLSALVMLSVASFAHPGRTDSKGGHHDGSSYHYHHGYPPHQHINGCPYDFDDQTRHGSSSSATGYKKPTTQPTKETDYLSLVLGFIALFLICLLCSVPVFGFSKVITFVKILCRICFGLIKFFGLGILFPYIMILYGIYKVLRFLLSLLILLFKQCISFFIPKSDEEQFKNSK